MKLSISFRLRHIKWRKRFISRRRRRGGRPGEEQASAAGASTAGGAGEDNVIDAEYVDVDENK